MNATEIAATLSVRAADVCRRYLPRGRKQGRYWTVGDTNGAKGRSLFVRLALQAYPRNGPTPRPTSMDICSISSVCAPAEHRCAAPWRRPSRSSHCRRPLPPMAPPPRACSAPGSTSSDPPRPTSPARAKHLGGPRRAVRFGGSATGATLLAGEGIETVLSLVTAVPGIHAAAALSAGSLGAFEPPQDLALLVIARDKDVEGGHAANRLQRRLVERGIPSIVIVPERSDFNDDLIALGQDTLAARLSPLIASIPSPRQRWKRGVGVGE